MTPQEIDQMSYSEAVARLEQIVGSMQSPDCDIDRLAEYTSTALELLKHCKAKLHHTDEAVQKALKALAADNS